MKNVIITGASGGIGSQIVEKFISKNFFVIGIYLTHPIAPRDCAEFFKCDLTNSKQVEDCFKKIIEKYKHIDCLVNCAGISQFKQIQDITDLDYTEVMNTNLKSAVLSIKNVVGNMISNKCGKIINISSMWGNVGASVESIYSASKGALNTLTLSLAKELAPSNITVNAVCPGLINTKMNARLTKAETAQLVQATPLGRIGSPQDVANLVAFLASEEADFITGQLICVDGGLSL